MTPDEVVIRAKAMLKRHHVSHIHFGLTDADWYLAKTQYVVYPGKVKVATDIKFATGDLPGMPVWFFDELMLHEIGHAKIPMAGHNEAWATTVRKMGGTPKVKYSRDFIKEICNG